MRGHYALAHTCIYPAHLASVQLFSLVPEVHLTTHLSQIVQGGQFEAPRRKPPNYSSDLLFFVYSPQPAPPASPPLLGQLLHPAAGGLEPVLEAGPPALAAEPLALEARPLVEALLGDVLGDFVGADAGVEQGQPAGEVDLAGVEVDGAADRGPQPVLDVGGGLLRQAHDAGQVLAAGRHQLHVLERV